MKQIRFNRKNVLRAIYLASAAVALSFGSAKAQITASDSVTFNGNSGFLTVGVRSNTFFVPPPAWSTPAGGGLETTYTTATDFGELAFTSAGVEVTNLGGPATTAQDFTETTHFSVPSGTGTGSNDLSVSLAALGNNNTFSSYNGNNYAAGIQVVGAGAGNIGIVSYANDGGTGLASGSLGTFTQGDLYDLTLQGTYDGLGNLTLTFTATDTTTPATATISTTIASPYTTDFFGFTTTAANEGSGSILFNDFSIDLGTAVPEPSEYALMLLGGMALLGTALRRKKVTA